MEGNSIIHYAYFLGWTKPRERRQISACNDQQRPNGLVCRQLFTIGAYFVPGRCGSHFPRLISYFSFSLIFPFTFSRFPFSCSIFPFSFSFLMLSLPTYSRHPTSSIFFLHLCAFFFLLFSPLSLTLSSSPPLCSCSLLPFALRRPSLHST